MERWVSDPYTEYVAIDTETNGEDVRDGRGYAMGISLSNGEESFYLPFRHTFDPEYNLDLPRLRPLLQRIVDEKKLVFFNAQFDLVSMRTLGVNAIASNFYCTMVLTHLLNENLPKTSLDLVTKWYLKDGGKRESDDFKFALKQLGWGGLPAELTADYASWDAKLTWDLFQFLKPKLQKENLGAVWNHKADMIRQLISMEGAGVSVDVSLCESMAETGRAELQRLTGELGGLNPGSPKDLSTLLLDVLGLPVVKETPAGKPSFDKFAMTIYEEEYLAPSNRKEAKLIFAYRGWQKSVSSNYQSYLDKLSPDGRLRPNYKLHGTVTGRLSCSSPNLQQIPRATIKPWNGKMKQCFIPKPGFVLLEADYSQLEFRLTTHFSNEPELVEAFSDPTRDVFTEIAATQGITRDQAKTLVYSILYGAGARRIANVFSVSLAEGNAIRQNFFRTYSNIGRASRFASERAIRDGRIQLWSGRFRHFRSPKEESHKAFNSFIQGTAADIVERTMVRAAKSGLDNPDCKMILQVHDSIVFEVREDLVQLYGSEILDCMSNVGNFRVPFKADLHYWGGEKVSLAA